MRKKLGTQFGTNKKATEKKTPSIAFIYWWRRWLPNLNFYFPFLSLVDKEKYE